MKNLILDPSPSFIGSGPVNDFIQCIEIVRQMNDTNPDLCISFHLDEKRSRLFCIERVFYAIK